MHDSRQVRVIWDSAPPPAARCPTPGVPRGRAQRKIDSSSSSQGQLGGSYEVLPVPTRPALNLSPTENLELPERARAEEATIPHKIGRNTFAGA
jgi:hypothetical protein